jgi:hypothetical protein
MCDTIFKLTKDIQPATQDAKSRWWKFKELVTCPNCGNDNGHAGVVLKQDVEITEGALNDYERKREKPNIDELKKADAIVREILRALDEIAIRKAILRELATRRESNQKPS